MWEGWLNDIAVECGMALLNDIAGGASLANLRYACYGREGRAK
jgi:hypothetical protein